jgi:predicted AlkP superfamily pyrophosphatase or phosphodiesterase
MVREVDKLIDIIKTKKFSENRFSRAIRIILKVAEIITDNSDLDESILVGVGTLYEYYDSIDAKTKVKLNYIVNIIYDRNKEVINKYSNETWIGNIIEAYKQSNSNEEIIFLLKILQFQQDQKKTTEVLRSGR